jgi:tripartite-type tricarboxylate transporter receptor subunit TctC
MPFVVKDLPFQVLDRTFIAMTVESPHIFAVHADSPLKTLEDVIKEVRKDPANFTWSTMGGISIHEIMVRQFFKVIGVDVSKTRPVATLGGGQVAAMVAGGHVKLGVVSSVAGLPVIKGGMVRPLMISSRKRDPSYPDIPTSAELGYPTVNIVLWLGVSGPPKLPSYIVDIWNETLQEILNDPTYIARLKQIGLSINYKGPLEMREHVKKEMEEVRELLGR